MAVVLNRGLLDGAHPELARRFLAGAARFAANVRVNSVLRDSALQQEFWDCAQFKNRNGYCPSSCGRSNCASANPPGTSNHEPHGSLAKSLAIDAEPENGDWTAYHAAMRAEWLVFTIVDSHGDLVEPWHCQCAETPAPQYEQGSEARLPSAPLPSPDPYEAGGRTVLQFIGD